MSGKKNKTIELTSKIEIKSKTKDIELSFSPSQTSTDIAFASASDTLMTKNEIKFFEQTIESADEHKVTKWGISFGWSPERGYGLHFDCEKTPKKKIVRRWIVQKKK